MITIQSAMLVALGFLAASLLTLLLAPAFWRRAVRLTSKRIKETMPLSDVEIRADKDRIRAEYAIKVHKLESEMEQVRLAEARQQIELNRRDASINELERELERLRASHEETLNARRVLEQTVADRLPRVEQRLDEAKRLLFTRDREIAELTRSADKQAGALAEAAAINAQQQSEIDRLTQSLASRAAQAQNGAGDPRHDGVVALRAELEALRGKTREQAQLLARLQSMAGRAGAGLAPGLASSETAKSGDGEPASAASRDAAASPEVERQLRALKARNEDQADEIVRLKAALQVFENQMDADGKMLLRESRIGLKARMQSLEAQSIQQGETIQKLRSELAAANERLARQASHFTSELKRLGAGAATGPGQNRRPAEPARLGLTERVAQARSASTGAPPASGPSNVASLPVTPKGAGRGAKAATTDEAAGTGGGASAEPAEPAAVPGKGGEVEAPASTPADATADSKGATKVEAERRPRLLDRISSLSRGS